MELKKIIQGWDGKAVAYIENVYEQFGKDIHFVDKLVTFMEQVALQKGASWLLKKHLESGGRVSAQSIAPTYQALPQLVHWETKLHILQCLPFIPIGEEKKDVVEQFLRDCLQEKNKFVRAWAYNGFYELAKQYPSYQEEVLALLQLGLEEEAASVKVRIRKALKAGF